MWEVTLGEMGGGGSEEVRQQGRKAAVGMIYSKLPLWAAGGCTGDPGRQSGACLRAVPPQGQETKCLITASL